MSLRSRAFAGVRWTTLSSAGRILLQLLQVTVLARMLAPADFGLVAVVIAIISVMQVFADGGVSNAILHYQDVSATESASLYWLNIAISAALASLLVLASPWLAVWYAEPALQSLLSTAAVTLLLGASGQQLRVVAQKQLRFVALAKVEFGGAVAGCAVAIALAVAHSGAFAIIIGSLTTAGVTTGLAWWYLADGWRPKGGLSWQGVRRFMRFGAHSVGSNLASSLNSQVDVLLGAQFLGASAMGLYSVPKDLSLRMSGIINPVVTEVSAPVMASVQTDSARLRQIYLQIVRMIASVTFPCYIGLAVFAPEVVRVVLGHEWDGASPLLRLLACWALLRSTGNPVGTLVVARGRPDLGLLWNLALVIVIPPAVWAGSRYGLVGMTIAMLLVALILFVPNWYFLVRPLSGAELPEYSRQFAAPLGISLVSGACGFLSVYSVSGDVSRLLLGGVVGASVYLSLSWHFNREWAVAMLELGGFSRWTAVSLQRCGASTASAHSTKRH